MTTLRGAATLVTGGEGTIGSTIVDLLLAADVSRIRILDNLVRGRRANLASALNDPRVELVVGDLRDVDLVHEMTKGSDLVFHEAAIRITPVSYTHLRAHETDSYLVCRLLLEKKKT